MQIAAGPVDIGRIINFRPAMINRPQGIASSLEPREMLVQTIELAS
jgi:hypothetical protein